MKKIILVRYGEIMLKGLNRHVFEDLLVKNIKRALARSGSGCFEITRTRGRIYVEPGNCECDFDKAYNELKKVFGIVSISPAFELESAYESIKSVSADITGEKIRELKAHNGTEYKPCFKVETRRGDKSFPYTSPEMNSMLGEHILLRFPELRVDVVNPDFILYLEIREHSYLYTRIDNAVGGFPACSNGKGLLLLSGGIDSPVAGWLMAKRGVEVEAVHFYSYPYTGERARQKVIDLAGILASYCNQINLHLVHFTKIQDSINENCPHDEVTIIMRRFMMRIAERIALANGCQALITGESLGQVASQTMQSLHVTNSVSGIPVFRPLISSDKNEIITIARHIGTFETSILPYEDCCTLFVAKHPVTKPRLRVIERSEQSLDVSMLVDDAVGNTETLLVRA